MVAHENMGRAVLVGEKLNLIWSANADLNVNAVIWAMGMAGLPDINPSAGIVAPGPART